jgi:flavin-dependent dehydrogenase
MQNFDVCIVGAGPAGIAASAVLNQAGARVAIINKPEAFPKANKSRWETLSPRIEVILQQLGFEDALKDSCKYNVTAHVSSWGSEEVVWESVIKRPDSGAFIVDRNQFDMSLCAIAAHQGIVFIHANNIDIERNRNYWSLFIKHPKAFEISASFLIDAAGYGAPIARRLGAKRIVVDKLVAQWLIFPTDCDTDKTVRIDALQDGWLFTVAGEKQRLLCFFTDGKILNPASKSSIKQMMEERIAKAPAIRNLLETVSISPISNSGVTFAATSTLHRAIGEYWLACGDAAQTYDPLSSQGCYQAFLSGCHAGTALIDYHNGSLSAFENYNRLIRTEFIQFLRTLCKQYRLESRWANSAFWKKRHDFFSNNKLQQLKLK